MHINDVLNELIPTKANVVCLDVWTSDGAVMHMKDVVCIKADFKNGTHLMKFVNNPSIKRLIRDYLIFKFNDDEVYI